MDHAAVGAAGRAGEFARIPHHDIAHEAQRLLVGERQTQEFPCKFAHDELVEKDMTGEGRGDRRKEFPVVGLVSADHQQFVAREGASQGLEDRSGIIRALRQELFEVCQPDVYAVERPQRERNLLCEIAVIRARSDIFQQ